MDFDFSEEHILLKEQLSKYLQDNDCLTKVRHCLENEQEYDEGIWRYMVQQGFTSSIVEPEYGGAGLSPLHNCVLSEELGKYLDPTPFFESSLGMTSAICMFADEKIKEKYLENLVSGKMLGTLALFEGAAELFSPIPNCKVANGKLNGKKTVVTFAEHADVYLVLATDESGNIVLALTENTEVTNTTKTTSNGRVHSAVSFNNVDCHVITQGQANVEKWLDALAVYMAFQQIGLSEKMMWITRDYALERYTFGRPIGTYQAVKHRLADMFVKLELARSNCYYAAWALDSDSEKLPEAAAVARVSATDCANFVTEEAIQMHGGVGFTWEHDAHLFIRKSMQYATALGGMNYWKRRIVSHLKIN